MAYKKPTESELAILQVLWTHERATVRFVNEVLNSHRMATEKPIGYTTTLKIMQLMAEKQLLQRDESGRSHVYEAMISEQETQQRLLNRFVEKTFKGSAMKLVMQALGNHEASSEELQQIRDFLDELEGKA